MHRREFLQSALAGSAAVATGIALSADNRVAIVDTHVHCFAGKDNKDFPYHANAPYGPEKATPPEDLLAKMKAAGVDYAVVVHPEPYQDDHRYLEHCLDVGKGKLKGTCLFFAGKPGALEAMAALVKRRKGQVVTARVHAYAPERLPPFGKPELTAFWKQAGELGLALQLHFEPRFAPGFEPLIKQFPDTKVIVDHLGRPMQGSAEEYARVLEWSRFPNTIVKISSLPDPKQYPHREVGPIIKLLTEKFGPSRLIYGGGYDENATGDTYRAYREKVRGLLSHLSADEQAQVLGGNAAKLFGFA